MFTGTHTAMVTPFRNGEVDEAALTRLIQAQVRAGVDGIVPVGTTGESPTLDYDEHIQVIALSVKVAAGRIKVLAGTGGNSTEEAIFLTQEAERAGADGSLQVAPYYNKPSQEGLFDHFKVIARNTKLPIVFSTASRVVAASRSASLPWRVWPRRAATSSASRRRAETRTASASCAGLGPDF